MNRSSTIATAAALALAAAAAGWWLQAHRGDRPAGASGVDSGRIAVEVAPVETGAVADVRRFSGTLIAGEAFTVAPKIGGQIRRLHVDIGDRVTKGQVVVELDDEDARQAVAEADAELAVARAEREQARADAELARRELARTEQLARRELASASELDAARAQAEARRAALAVAEARVAQREAALARARVALGYTRVQADWTGEDTERVVGERMVNAGDTVAANTPLLTVLGIAPIRAVAFAPERDYARLARGQPVSVVADALPGRAFRGEIARIAPRFAEDSRQARFEVVLPNGDRALKPGMFVSVRVTVAATDDATLVPAEALVRHSEGAGVYRVLEGEPLRVEFVPVTTGIEGEERIEIRAPALAGRVVTLGQQLLEDGAPIVIGSLSASP